MDFNHTSKHPPLDNMQLKSTPCTQITSYKCKQHVYLSKSIMHLTTSLVSLHARLQAATMLTPFMPRLIKHTIMLDTQ